MKKALALISVLLLTSLPAHSETWQQRNAEAQMREDMRRETKRQIEENNRRQEYNQQQNQKL